MRRDAGRALDVGRVRRAGKRGELGLFVQNVCGGALDGAHDRLVRADLGGGDVRLEDELRVELGIIGPGPLEKRLDVGLDLLAAHAGQRPDVAGELGLARVDAVEDARARHHADVHRRPEPAEGMPVVRERVPELAVHPLDEPRHRHRRVDRREAVGDGRVHLRPADPHLEQRRAARDEVDRLPLAHDAAGLADHRRVGLEQPGLGEPAGALMRSRPPRRRRARARGARPEALRRERLRPRRPWPPRPPSCRPSRDRTARRPRSRDPTDRCARPRGRPAASCRGGRTASASAPAASRTSRRGRSAGPRRRRAPARPRPRAPPGARVRAQRRRARRPAG